MSGQAGELVCGEAYTGPYAGLAAATCSRPACHVGEHQHYPSTARWEASR